MGAPPSIVVPCFNHAHFLGDAIDSALAQTVEVDVIVVDDGSTDATRDICAGYPQVRYLRQANQGLPRARNAGLTQAHGEYVVFLDADDRLLPGAVAAGLERLTGRPSLALTSGEHCYIDTAGDVIAQWQRQLPSEHHYQALLRGNYIGMCATVVFRRSILERVGGFDRSLRACEDYDLYLRIAREHPIDTHPTLVAQYRRHDSNMSRDPVLMLKLALTVLTRELPVVQSRGFRSDFDQGVHFWEDFYGPAISRQFTASSLSGLTDVAKLLVWLSFRYPALALRLVKLLAAQRDR